MRPTLFPVGMPAILKQYIAQPPCFTTKGQGAAFNVLERNTVKDTNGQMWELIERSFVVGSVD